MLAACLAVLGTWAAVRAGPAVDDAAVEALLKDVSSIDTGGNPASMAVWGSARALVASPDGRVFAAAGTLGNGRVVVLGHGGFVGTDKADSEVFAANAVVWLARKKESPIRIFGLSDEVAAELTRRGVKFEKVAGGPAQVQFNEVDVVIGSPQAFAKAGRAKVLEAMIMGGNGMLVTETAWGVLQLNKDLTLDTLAANTLLEKCGVRFDGEANSGYGKAKDYGVDRATLHLANADAALKLLAESSAAGKDETAAKDREYAAKVVGNAFESVPLESPFIESARGLAAEHRAELDGAYATMSGARLTPKSNALAWAMIDLDSRVAMSLPPGDVRAHASSAAFPGPVGEAREATVAIEIEPGVPGWHTTGLYAAPGEVVTVTVPEELANVGAVVQIGAWRDPHDHAYRVRLKNGMRRFEIVGTDTEIASAIGGPIYIDVPVEFAKSAKGSGAGAMSVTLRNVVRAPHFKLGVTDLEKWRSEIRGLGAPWAELETDNLVLTVPSEAIRDLDRPDLAMQHWDRVHEAMQSLEPRTANHWADRPYRYVADVSVSWGYMYCPSDGPIVIPASAAADMFKVENYDAEGENQLWGHYHEMGHSHQNPLWTDGATGEVTVNIFTVYALHTVNGYPLDSEAMRSTPQFAWETFEKQRSEQRKFDDAGGPFETLQYYALMWHEFGFDAFHTAFDAIRALPENERPSDTIAERNQFVVAFSEVVKRDLSNYASAWGVEVSAQTRERLRELKEWMPTAPTARTP